LSVLFEEVIGDQVEDATALEDIFAHRLDQLGAQDQDHDDLEKQENEEDDLHD
jgi:hypothetical protein